MLNRLVLCLGERLREGFLLPFLLVGLPRLLRDTTFLLCFLDLRRLIDLRLTIYS